MEKYKDNLKIGTSKGFWEDISYGGYIKPEEVLIDQEKAIKLREAIELLENWEQELIEDDKLNEL